MRSKGMEDLAVFSAREVKSAAAEETERDEYFSADNSEGQSKRQSHPSKVSES